MPSDRPRIYARLDEDTLERWKAFVTYHGLSDAAFIEAIGRNLPEPSARLPPWLAAVVKDARKIRGYRGDRRPPD